MIVTVGDKGLTAITGERICTLSATFVATANSKPTIFPKLYLCTSYAIPLTYLDGALISSRIP